MTAPFDPEYAAQARMRALQASAWGEKRCGDPTCLGCDAKRLKLCERASAPPIATAPPAPAVPAFVPVPRAVFLARVDVARRTGRVRTPATEVERPRAGREE